MDLKSTTVNNCTLKSIINLLKSITQ